MGKVRWPPGLNFVLTIPSSYLHRLDDELEMLDLRTKKRHMGCHYQLRHTSREDAIRSITVKEREVFEGPGFGKYSAPWLCIKKTSWICVRAGGATVARGSPASMLLPCHTSIIRHSQYRNTNIAGRSQVYASFIHWSSFDVHIQVIQCKQNSDTNCVFPVLCHDCCVTVGSLCPS